MWENKTRTPNFELSPYVSVKNTVSYAGYESIVEQLKKSIATGRKTVVVFDYYHGVDEKNCMMSLFPSWMPTCGSILTRQSCLSL